jgi:hypothetical protein
MIQTGRTNTAGKELGVNSNVSADIYDNSAWKQNLPQQLSLPAISQGFVSGIKRSVDWKSVFVQLISNATQTEAVDISVASELR